MKCPLCNTELWIGMTTTEVEGDTSAEEKTRVERVHHLICANKRCVGYKKVQKMERHQIYPEI